MTTKSVEQTKQDSQADRAALLRLLSEGSPLHRYVQWACATHGSPALYHVGCTLALLLYELSRRGYRLPRVVTADEYPLTAQFLLLGDSGTGKTTAFNAMQDFAQSFWSQCGLQVDPWVELSGSIEGITYAVHDQFDERLQSTPLLMFDGEVSQTFARRDPLVQLMCKLFDGRTIQSNYRSKQRKQDPGAAAIVNPRVCGVYCSTEQDLAPHFKDSHRSGGIYTRFIWLKPEFGERDIWLSQDHLGAKSLRAARESVVDAWSGWSVELETMSALSGFQFTYTAEAHGVLTHEIFEPFVKQFKSGIDDNFHGVRMRLLEKARVFAALHAAMRLDVQVKPDDVEFAAGLTKVFLESTLRTRSLGADEATRAAMRVAKAIRRSGEHGLLRRELYKQTRYSKKVLEAAVEQLLDQDLIFVDNSDRARYGRYLHVETALGRELQAKQQLRRDAENTFADIVGRKSPRSDRN